MLANKQQLSRFVMCVYIYVNVCPQAYLKKGCSNLTKFSEYVAWSSSGGNAIGYVLPVS